MKPILLTLFLALSSSALAGLEEGKAALEKENFALAEQEFAGVVGPEGSYWQGLNRLKKRSSLSDITLGRQYLEDAAKAGYAPAMTALGESYGRTEGFGSGEAEGYLETEGEKALEWLGKAAKLGDAKGQFRLAQYLEGEVEDADKNQMLALEWYKKAAAGGHPDALFHLSRLYFEGKGVVKDPEQAQSLLVQAANAENTDAVIELAAQYEKSTLNADLEISLNLYLRAAKAGDVRGMSKMGNAYLDGEIGKGSFPKNLTEALKWLEAAAVKGDGDAGYRAGYIYATGLGVGVDLERAEVLLGNRMSDGSLGFTALAGLLENNEGNFKGALLWYSKGAEAEDRAAQEGLACLYLSKKGGVPYDPALAFKWALESVSGGPVSARELLASLYEEGIGTEPNLDKALEGYETAALYSDEASLKESLARVQFKLGVAYEQGQGKAQDFSQAAGYYSRASDLRADAALRLAALYWAGQGLPQDDTKGAALIRTWAERGDVEAQRTLAAALESGRGVARDLEQAKVWYGKAAKQGDARSKAALEKVQLALDTETAQAKVDFARKLGETDVVKLYNSARELEKTNLEQALELYQKVASLGDSLGKKAVTIVQFSIGNAYYLGQGRPVNFAKAAEYFRQAAEGGSAAAAGNLGAMYYNGEGVTRDTGQAIVWVRKAAESGDGVAQRNLGFAFENGYGVTKSLEQAKLWYGKAAAQGDQAAKDALTRLNAAKP